MSLILLLWYLSPWAPYNLVYISPFLLFLPWVVSVPFHILLCLAICVSAFWHFFSPAFTVLLSFSYLATCLPPYLSIYLPTYQFTLEYRFQFWSPLWQHYFWCAFITCKKIILLFFLKNFCMEATYSWDQQLRRTRAGNGRLGAPPGYKWKIWAPQTRRMWASRTLLYSWGIYHSFHHIQGTSANT